MDLQKEKALGDILWICLLAPDRFGGYTFLLLHNPLVTKNLERENETGSVTLKLVSTKPWLAQCCWCRIQESSFRRSWSVSFPVKETVSKENFRPFGEP